MDPKMSEIESVKNYLSCLETEFLKENVIFTPVTSGFAKKLSIEYTGGQWPAKETDIDFGSEEEWAKVPKKEER